MKRVLSFGFVLMGFGFMVTQGLIVRELLVAFFGNELSIGIILGNWLVLEAIGSGLLGKLADRWKVQASSFAGLQVLLALFLPVCLYAAYTIRSILGAIPGEGIGLVSIFYSSFLVLTPLALVDGAMFAFGCRAFASVTGRPALAVGWVYVYEALGALVGGIVFTYLFIPFLDSLQIVLLLCGLNLFSAVLILALSGPARSKRLPVLIAILVLLIASFSVLLSPLAGEIQRWATRQQWAGHNLVYSQDSVYGNVAVVQREAQYTFYADGIPILTAPVPDVALSEEIVHLPLLFIPQPRRALVLSGGVGGVLRELGKYPLSQVDYAELDPLLIQAVLEFPTPLTAGELSDPRVNVEHLDGRLLVREKSGIGYDSQDRYDLVVVNLPYPSTLQLNRFYTVEFFQMVRGLVTEEGILVIRCPGTLTYMSDELRSLNAMTFRTLQEAFPYVRPIPGEVTLWLASPSAELSTAPVEALVEKWNRRGLETRLMTASHIRLKLDQRRLDWFWASLGEKSGEKVAVNRDLYPVGLFHGLSYWNALFSPDLAHVFAFMRRLNLQTFGLPIIGCVLLFLVAARLTAKASTAIIPIAIITTGFTGMTADLILVFAFQTFYGYVYHWIGLLIAAFMAGLSLGGVLMARRLALPSFLSPACGRDRREARSALLKLELVIVLYWALLPLALSALHSYAAAPRASTSIQALLFILNAVAGFLVGSQFPLANRIWLKRQDNLRGAAGVLYACDLVGAFLGAIVVSVVLIPVLGIIETCLLAAILKLGSWVLVVTSPSL